MADTNEFFSTYLPNKLASNPTLKEIGAVFQFDITGAGTWTLDLSAGEVREGAAENAGCVVTCGKEDWEKMLDNPSMGMQLFMMGRLKASNLGLATQLQKILS